MSLDGTTYRRATLDDLDALRGLWRECRLPDYELERRFTEFQVALDSQGWILGALAIRFAGPHAQVHSLALRRADLAGPLTAALWERVLQVAHQQGAQRVWVRDPAPFWEQSGFAPCAASERAALPAAFGQPAEAWLVKRLREDPLKLIAAEEQLEAYLEMERLKTDRLVRRGQVLKLLATAFAGVLLALALGALFLTMRRNRASERRRLPEPRDAR